MICCPLIELFDLDNVNNYKPTNIEDTGTASELVHNYNVVIRSWQLLCLSVKEMGCSEHLCYFITTVARPIKYILVKKKLNWKEDTNCNPDCSKSEVLIKEGFLYIEQQEVSDL